MNVLITGASGFIGQVLLRRILHSGIGGVAVSKVIALDLVASEDWPSDCRIQPIIGSVADQKLLREACAAPLDVVFHLASLPGGAAEKNYTLGRQVNLDATLQLLESMHEKEKLVRFVYASSVAVYGDNLPNVIDDHTLPVPALTYGTHKLACEALVADATRKGWIEGCSLRLPGVVARPGSGEGLMSAFMSQIFWKLASGLPLVVPVTSTGKAWWISAISCADNLIHAATVDTKILRPSRSYLMPSLHLSVGEVVDALARRYGENRKILVDYRPEPIVQKLFASYPPLNVESSTNIGFRSDGSVDLLVTNAMVTA
jgi:nucleoside-diphosphate-sugar epimerase